VFRTGYLRQPLTSSLERGNIEPFVLMALYLTAAIADVTTVASGMVGIPHLPLPALLLQFSDKKGNIYNILWVLVFAFATLNILGLVTRRFEPARPRLNFGELIAILVVVASIFLLASEMLHMFKFFPIRLNTR
jgi:hypothetical protein